MTIAVADATMGLLYEAHGGRAKMVASMKHFGRMFPRAGYGSMFRRWLQWDEPQPYGSYGNGSAMRVSSVAWLFDELESVRAVARLSAEVSHNHPEGIKGALATSDAIFLARTGSNKEEIKQHIENNYNYDLSRKLDDIRPHYKFDVSCKGSVPESIICFLEAEDFEDTVRNAVSLGGDADTQAAIGGSIASAYWDVPSKIAAKSIMHLDSNLLEVFIEFRESFEK